MTKDEFYKLKKGDKLLFKFGRVREILSRQGATIELEKIMKDRFSGTTTFYSYSHLKACGALAHIPNRDLIKEMQHVCSQHFKDGRAVYFVTMGMRGRFNSLYMVRISRHSLFMGENIESAIILALDDFYKKHKNQPIQPTEK